MRGRDLVLGLLVAVGWAGVSVALQQAPPPPGAEPDAQQADPATSVEVDENPSDPFAQFDLGVASLAEDDTVSEWTGLATSGIVLVPETVEVSAGQTIDALLLERGVRPDPYARSLVAEINPNLSEAFEVAEGDSLTLFLVQRPAAGLFSSGRIALQPFQAERDVVRFRLEELADLTAPDQTTAVDLDPFTLRLERAERRALLTDRRQLYEAASILQSYNVQVRSALVAVSENQSPQAYNAPVGRLTRRAVADIRSLPSDRRKATIQIRIRSAGSGPSGTCEIGWAPLGFSPYKSSRAFEAYESDVIIRVPASALDLWVARSRAAPPDEALRSVRKAQLIDGNTLPLVISTPGGCIP